MSSPAQSLFVFPVWGVALALGCCAPIFAQDVAAPAQPPHAADTAGAFLDTGAAALLRRARAERVASDRTLRSYTALVRSRVGIGMRMPLKDRTLFRAESAARVRWSRDADDVVHVLAGRAQSPGGVEPTVSGPGILPLDPTADRLYFGLMFGERRSGRNDDFWLEHPLGEDAERHYRFQSGDTLSIRLQDGREVRVVELRVIPRRLDPHTVRGVLWIDASSGALVQGAFRLARKVDIVHDLDALDDDDRRTVGRVPFITPMEFDISLLTVEYSLWDMRHWLPRAMRFEGMVRTGVLHFPASFDVSYQMSDVTTDADPQPEAEAAAVARVIAEWGGAGDSISTGRENDRRYTRIAPVDRSALLTGDLLPPPIWTDAPGFLTEQELGSIHERLAAVPLPGAPGQPVRFGWGYGEPGMLRYNRVEALSVGARVTVPLPHVTLVGIGRLGVADLHPNAELLLRRETIRRTIELRGYHELATAEPSRRALGPGNSLAALLLGRDEGEYYRATGAEVAISPPWMRRRVWEVRTYVEVQHAVTANTHVALPRAWNDSVFRPNITADEATQYGALVRLRPWWGVDPHRAQAGADVLLQGEAGDFRHARGRLTLRAAVPLGRHTRLGIETAAGTSEGAVPVQRLFFLGGASTLRGYEPGALNGTSMGRARLELARTTSFAGLSVFSDAGWAGDRSSIRADDLRWATGIGASLLDGTVRLDLARALRHSRSWRLELYVDALL
jgi:hypothetical protein